MQLATHRPFGRRSVLAVSLSVILLLGAAGCDDSEETASTGGSSASQTPSEPTASVSNNDQLVGAWYTTDPEGALLGLEFGKDAKVMLYLDLSTTVTWDYSVLEGGRIRMVAPASYGSSGQTIVFRSKVDAESLLLEPEGGTVDLPEARLASQQFRRLKGQTIAEAHRAGVAESARVAEAALESVRKRLAEPKLVLESADPQLRLGRYALELEGGPDAWQGFAWSESNPPLKRSATASVGRDGDMAVVMVTLGELVGPPGEAARAPLNIRLVMDKASGNLHDQGLALRSSEETHAAVVGGYEKVVAEREAKLAAAIDPLGAYARIEGQFVTSNNPNARPTAVRLGLLRVEGKPQFMVADLRNTSNPVPEQFTMAGDVQLVGEKVLIVCPQLQFEFEPAQEDGKLLLRGGYQGWEVEVPVVEAVSPDELVARRTAARQFVEGQLAQGLTLRGRMHVENGAGLDLPVPASLMLQSDAARNLAGTLMVLHLNAEFQVAGAVAETLEGLLIHFKSTQMANRTPYSTLAGRERSGTLDVLWRDGQPVISGAFKGGFQIGPVDLDIVSSERLGAEKQKLQELLAAGAQFELFDVNVGNNQPLRLELKLDSATGALTGEADAGINTVGVGAAALTGELLEQDGFVLLKVRHPEGLNARNQRTMGANHMLWALFDGENIVLSGWSLSDNSNPPTLTPTKLALVR